MSRDELLKLAQSLDSDLAMGVHPPSSHIASASMYLRWAHEQLYAYQRGSEYAAEEYVALQERFAAAVAAVEAARAYLWTEEAPSPELADDLDAAIDAYDAAVGQLTVRERS
jgi:hypothetical protein